MKPYQVRDSILIALLMILGVTLTLLHHGLAGGVTLGFGILGFILQGGKS